MKSIVSSLALVALLAMPKLALAEEAKTTDNKQPVDYSKKENWLCLPEYPNACGVDLTTTIVKANGATKKEKNRMSDRSFAGRRSDGFTKLKRTVER